MSKRKTTKITLGSGSVGVGAGATWTGARLVLDELQYPNRIGVDSKHLVDPNGRRVVIEVNNLESLEVLERAVARLRSLMYVGVGSIG